MSKTDDKMLFSPAYRRRGYRPAAQPRGERLLSGHALAEAQRLSRQRVQPEIYVSLLSALDLTILLFAGLFAQKYFAALPNLGWVQLGTLWLGAITAVTAIRSMNVSLVWCDTTIAPSTAPLRRYAVALSCGSSLAMIRFRT